MANPTVNDKLVQHSAEQLILIDQLKRVEQFNGRAAMLGIVIGIVVEGLTGFGIAHQLGLGALGQSVKSRLALANGQEQGGLFAVAPARPASSVQPRWRA